MNMNLDMNIEETMSKVKKLGGTSRPRQQDSGHKKRNAILNQSCSVLEPADGTHHELCGRVVLSRGGGGAARCFYANVCLGEGVSVTKTF